MGNTNLSTFDYASLDRTTAEFLLQETKEIKTLMKRSIEGIIETGERLQKVKKRLQHGEFMAWVENEVKCHYSTALHFMRVWETFGDQKEQIADAGINVSVLYLLSAPSTSEQLRTEIINMAKSGNPVSFAEAKRLKKKYDVREVNSSKRLENEITTIDTGADSISSKIDSTKLYSTRKHQIVNMLPKQKFETKFWSLGNNLLYCGSARSPEFSSLLPQTVSLNIGFPDSSSWSQETLFPVSAKSTLLFHSIFQDLDIVTLKSIIKKSIELCTESEEAIIFSFLPYPEMLLIAAELKCRCLVAEPDLKRCQNIVSFWESIHDRI